MELQSEIRASLARIEERLKYFIEKVEDHEEQLDELRDHVGAVRTVVKVGTYCLGALSAIAGLAIAAWQGTLKP